MPVEGWKDCLANGIDKSKPIAPREELRSLSDKQRYLLIEGLARFQNVPMLEPLSYFQIAGIHGYPFKKYPFFAPNQKDWNTPFPDSVNNTGADSFRGFCTHTSILFLPWHRPYLALFESSLYEHVNKIAEGIADSDPNKAEYTELATRFRWPYWDWAKGDTSSFFPFEASVDNYGTVFTRGFDQSTLPISSESVFVNDVFGKGKGALEKYNPLHHAPFESDENFRAILDESDLEGIKYFDPVKYKRNDENKAYVNKTVRYPNLSDAEQQKKVLYTFAEWFQDPSYRPESDSRDLVNPFRNVRERVAYLLLSYKDYAAMSHNKYSPETWNQDKYYGVYDPAKKPPITANAEIWASMEGIHNTCHNACGGTKTNGLKENDNNFQDWSGHMSGITRSSFDPIFWLHHSNIDRLWAIWQALHDGRENSKVYNTWVTQHRAGAGNWFSQGFDQNEDTGQVYHLGDYEDAKTPLLPFKYTDKQEEWYMCEQTRIPQTFNYYYDEVDGLESFPISDADAAKLTNTIKGLYGSAASIIEQSIANAGKTGVDDNAGETLLKQVAALQKISAGEIDPTFESLKTTDFIKEGFDLNTLLKDSTEAQRRIRDIVTDGNYLEWILNIKGQRHAFDGNYQVTVFLDKVPDPDVEAPQMWPFNPNFVGNFSPLGQKSNTSCGRCQDQQTNNVEVTGQIPLTIALIERYLAGTLDKFDDQTTVEAYLTKNLHWRVLAGGNLVADQSEVAGLKVFVVTNEVTLPTDGSGMPIYSPDVTIHASITEGRGHGTGVTPDQVTVMDHVALAH